MRLSVIRAQLSPASCLSFVGTGCLFFGFAVYPSNPPEFELDELRIPSKRTILFSVDPRRSKLFRHFGSRFAFEIRNSRTFPHDRYEIRLLRGLVHPTQLIVIGPFQTNSIVSQNLHKVILSPAAGSRGEGPSL